jgi:hypothetical protein
MVVVHDDGLDNRKEAIGIGGPHHWKTACQIGDALLTNGGSMKDQTDLERRSYFEILDRPSKELRQGQQVGASRIYFSMKRCQTFDRERYNGRKQLRDGKGNPKYLVASIQNRPVADWKHPVYGP